MRKTTDEVMNTKICPEGRESYWEELTDKEKIERMRGIVKRNVRRINSLEQIIEKIERHLHNPATGEILLRYNENKITGEMDRGENDKYFE